MNVWHALLTIGAASLDAPELVGEFEAAEDVIGDIFASWTPPRASLAQTCSQGCG